VAKKKASAPKKKSASQKSKKNPVAKKKPVAKRKPASKKKPAAKATRVVKLSAKKAPAKKLPAMIVGKQSLTNPVVAPRQPAPPPQPEMATPPAAFVTSPFTGNVESSPTATPFSP
jgi:hypothetical protein